MRFTYVLGLVLMLSGVGAFGVAWAQPAPAGQPLKLFEAMMPTLSHPRCANCHGGTNALTGDNHPGGEVSDVPVDENGDMFPGMRSNAQCIECHDEPPPGAQPQVWRLAPKRISFNGKDAPTLCNQMRSINGLAAEDQAMKEKFIDHLATDQLIGFAFEGRRGMLENSPSPPPMTLPQFIAAAERWLDEGHARCGSGWTGTIVQKTSIHTVSPGSDMATEQTVSIDVSAGVATAHVKMTGHSLQDQRPQQGCQLYSHETFSVDRTVPGTVSIAVSPPQAVPSDLPQLPQELRNLPGFEGLDIPGLIGGGSVTLAFSAPPVPGERHIETQFLTLPPEFKCQKIVQDPSYNYAASVMGIMKPLEGNDVDHLTGHDIKQFENTVITTDWDLRND